MPLIQSPSNKARSANVAEVIRSYKNTGKIGTSHPANKEKATAQAVAIAYKTQRENK